MLDFIHSRSVAVLLPSILLVLSGCATTPAEDQAAVDAMIEEQTSFTPQSWATSVDSAELENAREVDWITLFDDELLASLIQETLDNNFDLLAASANVERANALAVGAGAQLLPQVNLAYAPSRAGSPSSAISTTSSQSLSAQLSWELDLWGRISAGQRGAVASAEAAAADYQFARHSLAAATARAYFVTIEAGKQEQILSDILGLLEETFRIVDVQYKNGLASGQDVALTKSDLASTREQLITLQASQREALRALEVLLGRYPKGDLAVNPELPPLPSMPPVGVPSEILERRPDIVASERRVAAAYNALNQAKAARLPSFSLTSVVGGVSSSLSSITDSSNVTWNLAGNLLAPIFDGGAREAQVEASTAEQKAAVSSYAQAALQAFNEVENNLDLANSLIDRKRELTEALAEAEKAYRIAQLRHKEGEIALIDLLSIQQRVLTANSNLTSLQRIALEQRVNLFLALGGNWGEAE